MVEIEGRYEFKPEIWDRHLDIVADIAVHAQPAMSHGSNILFSNGLPGQYPREYQVKDRPFVIEHAGRHTDDWGLFKD